MRRLIRTGWTYNLEISLVTKKEFLTLLAAGYFDSNFRKDLWDAYRKAQQIAARTEEDIFDADPLDPKLYALRKLCQLTGKTPLEMLEECEKAWDDHDLFPEMLYQMRREYKHRLFVLNKQGGVARRHYLRLFNTKLLLPPAIAQMRMTHWQRLQPKALRPVEDVALSLNQYHDRRQPLFDMVPKRLFYIMSAVAAAIVLIIVQSSATEALRGSFFALLPQNVGIENKEYARIDTPVNLDPDAPFIIYELGWMPEGFELINEQSSTGFIMKTYSSDSSSFIFIQRDSRDITGVDIEKTVISEIEVNSAKIFIASKDDYIGYAWRLEDTIFSIESDIPQEQIIEIIKNIRRVKN